MNLIKALNLTFNFQKIQVIEEHVKHTTGIQSAKFRVQENNLVSSANKLQREGLETYRLRDLILRDLILPDLRP